MVNIPQILLDQSGCTSGRDWGHPKSRIRIGTGLDRLGLFELYPWGPRQRRCRRGLPGAVTTKVKKVASGVWCSLE